MPSQVAPCLPLCTTTSNQTAAKCYCFFSLLTVPPHELGHLLPLGEHGPDDELGERVVERARHELVRVVVVPAVVGKGQGRNLRADLQHI